MFGILTSGEQTCITCWILILYIFKVKKTIQLIVVNKQSEWENTFGSPKFPCVTHMQNCVNATGNLHDSYVSICDSDSTWKNLWYTYTWPNFGKQSFLSHKVISFFLASSGIWYISMLRENFSLIPRSIPEILPSNCPIH